MLKVTLTSVIGKKYLLTGTQQSSPVVCPEEALVGLVAEESRTDVAVPGAPGVVAGQARYGAIQTELPFMLNADTGEKMEALYREFRQGWSRSKPCVMQVEADRAGGPYFLNLVLDRHLGGVPVDMSRRTSTVVTVPVFNPVGMFRSALKTGTRSVTVTNLGDVPIYPKIRNLGAGGPVTTPSGARFTLPKSTTATVFDTDPRRLRLPGAFPESVPPGKSGTWVLPTGASLEWTQLVVDPWA